MASTTIPERRYRIYRITCSVTRKLYFGLTSESLGERWSKHLYKAKNGSCYALHAAIRKYGAAAFVIETVCEANDFAAASVIERRLIAEHGSLCPAGYNISEGGEGTPGVRRPLSEAHKAAISAFHSGRTRPPETGVRISAALRGRTPRPEVVAKMAATKRGQRQSPETVEKRAAKLRGRKMPIRQIIGLVGGTISCGRRNPTGLKGVKPTRGRWLARITIDRKEICLGVFPTKEEAHQAYIEAARRRVAGLSKQLPP